MARKSMTELKADLLTLFPDNNTGLIDPIDLRAFLSSYIDAIRPAYGVLQRTTPNVQALTVTPQTIAAESGAASEVADYSIDAGFTTITRLEAGSVRGVFNCAISGPNGAVVLAELYKDGTPTGWITSSTCTGAAEPIALSLSFLAYNPATATYDMRARMNTGTGSITFDDIDFIIETVPVNTY